MNHSRKTISRRRGLSLFEVMIGLVLTAMLLTAVAVAFNIAGTAVEQNDHFFRSSQACRFALDVIMLDVRTASATGISVPDSAHLDVTTYDYNYPTTTVKDYTYVAPSGGKPGYLEVSINGGAETTLVPDVSACTFSSTTGGGNAQTGQVSGLTLTLTVNVNGDPVTLSGSAVPRTNLLN